MYKIDDQEEVESLKQKKSVVITDLDDTLWNWFAMWQGSFEPFLHRISETFNIEIADLKSDFKRLHQKYGTSEASFIYNELTSLSSEQKLEIDIETDTDKSILHEYYSNKKRSLKLYQGVRETLLHWREQGTLVIGFTESNAFFTKYRLKTLGLDGLLDCIYAPIGFDLPDTVGKTYSPEYWEPNDTEFRYLPRETKKPASDVLEVILYDFGIDKDDAIYVGDKLVKDIGMANEVGIDSLYAKYGDKSQSEAYRELLVDVTHWTDEDVTHEREINKNPPEDTTPNFVIESNFEQILSFYEFNRFENRLDKAKSIPVKSSPLNPSEVIQIWTKTIDVQQHFNDLALKIRSMAITVFTFILGGMGYAEQTSAIVRIDGHTISATALIAAFGTILMWAFFYMDRLWYHKLLLGSVFQGAKIEKIWGEAIPELQLTKSIGNESPHRLGPLKTKKRGPILIHSSEKFWLFYGTLTLPLLVVILALEPISKWFILPVSIYAVLRFCWVVGKKHLDTKAPPPESLK